MLVTLLEFSTKINGLKGQINDETFDGVIQKDYYFTLWQIQWSISTEF